MKQHVDRKYCACARETQMFKVSLAAYERATYGLRESNFTILTCNCCTDSARSTRLDRRLPTRLQDAQEGSKEVLPDKIQRNGPRKTPGRLVMMKLTGGARTYNVRVSTACTRQRGNRTEIVRCKHVQLTYHLRNVRCTQPLTARRVVQTTYVHLASDVTVRGTDLEQVNEFSYLGSLQTADCSSSREVKIRIAKSTSVLGKLKHIWASSNISTKTKIYLLRSLVLSIFLYGAEAWTLNAEITKRINAFEMNCYRRLLQIHWSTHTTNEEVKYRVKSLAGPLPSFLSLVNKRKLQWFGHVTRAKGTLAHTTLQGKAEGGRMRGRPRRTWTSDLKEWTGHPLSHLTSLAENRPGWITLVDSLVAPTAGQTAMGPVSQHIHIESPGHTVDLEGVRILDTEQDYFKRGIKEAIYIRALQPSLNRDGGRYRLQTTFDPLLTSHVGKITCPQHLGQIAEED
ncbi:hypothetical protein Bbelb_342600 [Branchiostoma belcheri]|nr:hypothetical protein Bbelb_342600 [Branchiostoma belcheri]